MVSYLVIFIISLCYSASQVGSYSLLLLLLLFCIKDYILFSTDTLHPSPWCWVQDLEISPITLGFISRHSLAKHHLQNPLPFVWYLPFILFRLIPVFGIESFWVLCSPRYGGRVLTFLRLDIIFLPLFPAPLHYFNSLPWSSVPLHLPLSDLGPNFIPVEFLTLLPPHSCGNWTVLLCIFTCGLFWPLI